MSVMDFGFWICDLRLKEARDRAIGPARRQSKIKNQKSKIRRSRRGFSFTEVLFAVMILGIGFIMVAAIFPVAIQQAKTSTEETNGAAIARGGVTYLEQIASDSTMPATNNVVVGPDYDGEKPFPPNPFPPNFVNQDPNSDNVTISTVLRGSLVTAGDSRYAWLPLYRRAGNPFDRSTWSPFAQVFMIPVLARNQSQYINAQSTRLAAPNIGQELPGSNGTFPPGTAIVRGDLTDGKNGAPDVITFKVHPEMASEGAYVIVADARQNPLNAVPIGKFDTRVAPHLAGLIFRLGNPVTTGLPDTWELMPGFDFQPIRVDVDNNPRTSLPPAVDGKEFEVTGLTNVAFFIVGRARSTDLSSGNPNKRDGAAQDVTAYTTFVTVK